MKSRVQFSLAGLLLLMLAVAVTSPIWMRLYEDATLRYTVVPTDQGQFPKVSPFRAVTFRAGRTEVVFNDGAYQLLSINGVSPHRLLRIAAFAFEPGLAEKRFAEDLPAVLHAAGMDEVGDSVQLVLWDRSTGQKVVVPEAPMTRKNRMEVYDRRHAH